MKKRFSILYRDPDTRITHLEYTYDKDEIEDLICELESCERDDVCMIDIVDENDEPIDTVWTEEEGIFPRYQ